MADRPERGARRAEVPLPPMPAAWREPAEDTQPSTPRPPAITRPAVPPPPRPPVMRSPVVRPPAFKPGYYGMPIAPPPAYPPPPRPQQRYAPPGYGTSGYAASGNAATGYAATGYAATGYAATGYAATVAIPVSGTVPGTGPVSATRPVSGMRPVSGTRPRSPIPYPGLPASAPPMPAMGSARAAPDVHPLTGEPLSDRSGVVAGMLQLLLGWVGAGRLYTGHVAIALAQLGIVWVIALLMVCGFGVTGASDMWVLGWLGLTWPAVDGIILLCGGQRDSEGRRLR